MNSMTYYRRNRDVILNRAKDYYKNDKGRLRVQARDKYRIKQRIKNKRIWKTDTIICLKKRKKS